MTCIGLIPLVSLLMSVEDPWRTQCAFRTPSQ
jgi:hypothetical protein